MKMRVAKYAMCCCAIALVFGAGCATSQNTKKSWLPERYVQTLVFDKGIPFPKQGVYSWYTPNERKNRQSVEEHDLILKAIEAGLLKRGFVNSPGEKNPNFYMAYHFIRGENTTDQGLNENYQFKSADRWFPGSETPHNYAQRTLVVDVVCAVDRCPRWRCSVQVAIPDEMGDVEKQALLNRVAERITRNMPPKGAKLVNP
jgi:hypothetical protein